MRIRKSLLVLLAFILLWGIHRFPQQPDWSIEIDHPGRKYFFGWSFDNRVLVGCVGKSSLELLFLNPEDGRVEDATPVPGEWSSDPEWTPNRALTDGARRCVCGDYQRGAVKVVDLDSGEIRETVHDDWREIRQSLKTSPSGRWKFYQVWDFSTHEVWNLVEIVKRPELWPTGDLCETWNAGELIDVRFSDDERRIATLWRLTNGHEELRIHEWPSGQIVVSRQFDLPCPAVPENFDLAEDLHYSFPNFDWISDRLWITETLGYPRTRFLQCDIQSAQIEIHPVPWADWDLSVRVRDNQDRRGTVYWQTWRRSIDGPVSRLIVSYTPWLYPYLASYIPGGSRAPMLRDVQTEKVTWTGPEACNRGSLSPDNRWIVCEDNDRNSSPEFNQLFCYRTVPPQRWYWYLIALAAMGGLWKSVVATPRSETDG